MKNIAAYARIETDLSKLHAYIYRRGWKIAANFNDEPALPMARDQMLAQVGTYDAVVVNRFLDLGQSFRDLVLTVAQLVLYQKPIYSASEPLMSTDTSSAAGRALSQFFYMMGCKASPPYPNDGSHYTRNNIFDPNWVKLEPDAKGIVWLTGMDWGYSFPVEGPRCNDLWFLNPDEQPDTEE